MAFHPLTMTGRGGRQSSGRGNDYESRNDIPLMVLAFGKGAKGESYLTYYRRVMRKIREKDCIEYDRFK